LSNLKSQLSSLKTKVDVLKDPTLFSSRKVGVSNSTIAQASVSSGTPLGPIQFQSVNMQLPLLFMEVQTLGQKLAQPVNVSGVVIGSAPFFLQLQLEHSMLTAKKYQFHLRYLAKCVW
jgi:hypothetical protein